MFDLDEMARADEALTRMNDDDTPGSEDDSE
jgi:hypothetical protein